MSTGQKVLWLDFDSDRYETVNRLCAIGVPGDTQDDLFDYRQPDQSPERNTLAREALREGVYGLVIIDGVTDAMSLLGMSIKDNDDFSTFARKILRPLAARGAAVVLVDHVTKSEDGRGRFAIGAQSKMSVLTGASYVVDMTDLVAPGRTGQIRLRVGKDRPGYVRARSSTWRGKDRMQEAARIEVSSDDDGIRMSVHAPVIDPFEDTESDRPNRSRGQFDVEIINFLKENQAVSEASGVLVKYVREALRMRGQDVSDTLSDLQQRKLIKVVGGAGPKGKTVWLNT